MRLRAVRLENPHQIARSMVLLPVVAIKAPYFVIFSAGFLVVCGGKWRIRHPQLVRRVVEFQINLHVLSITYLSLISEKVF